MHDSSNDAYNQEEMELSTQVVLHANAVYYPPYKNRSRSSSNQGDLMSSKLEYTAVGRSHS